MNLLDCTSVTIRLSLLWLLQTYFPWISPNSHPGSTIHGCRWLQDIRFRTHLLRGTNRVYRFLPRSASGDDPHGHLPWMYFYDPWISDMARLGDISDDNESDMIDICDDDLRPELKRHLMLMFKDHILFKWYLSVFCAQFGPDIDTDCPCSTKDRPTMPYSTPPGQEDLEYVSDELPDPKSLCKDHQGAKYLDRKHFCTIQIHPVYPVRVCWSSV